MLFYICMLSYYILLLSKEGDKFIRREHYDYYDYKLSKLEKELEIQKLCRNIERDN
jgi:hypothetical protein